MRSVSTSSISFALSFSHVPEKLLPLHAPSPVGTARQNKMESEQTSESLWDRWMRLTKATIRTDFSPSHQPLFPAGGRKDHFCSSMCKWAAGLAQYANRIPRACPRGVEAETKEQESPELSVSERYDHINQKKGRRGQPRYPGSLSHL